MQQTKSVNLEGGVGGSSWHAHVGATGWPTDRHRDEIQQAASLATWEDEDGSTAKPCDPESTANRERDD